MDKLERYIEDHSRAGTEFDNALLAELDRVTNLRVIQPKMVSGRAQGGFLTLITRMLRPRLVLEIGTFTGYSALSIAAGLEDATKEEEFQQRSPRYRNPRAGACKLPEHSRREDGAVQENAVETPVIHTVEIDDELEDIARSFFDRSPHGYKIDLHIGSALDVVPRLSAQLGRPFDMVFIDGDKREYLDYYRMIMGDGGAPSMVSTGTIILTDNVLWYGKVAEPDAIKQADHMSHSIIEFNRLVATDPRVENVILPLRDGINLIRVK